MKRKHLIPGIVVGALTLIVIYQYKQSQRQSILDEARADLEQILTDGEAMQIRPAPGNQLRELMVDSYGRGLLEEVDVAHDRLSFDPVTGAFACVWNGPDAQQVLFVDQGNTGLVLGLLSQIRVESVSIEDGQIIFGYTASSNANEQPETLGLQQGTFYQSKIDLSDLAEDKVDLVGIWMRNTQRDGAYQPATAPESNSEGNEKPEPETKERPQ